MKVKPGRDAVFSMRVTAAEADEIKRLAAEAGLTASSWIRQLVLRSSAPSLPSGETTSTAPRWTQVGEQEYATEGIHWLTPGVVDGATITIGSRS